MLMNRRKFLYTGAVFLAGSSLFMNPKVKINPGKAASAVNGIDHVREQFNLTDENINMAALLISAHPEIVRNAIERHRQGLDTDPGRYILNNNRRSQTRARQAAANYLGVRSRDVALTESTTMGIGLVYNGLILKEGDEIIIANNDYYSTYESVNLATQRTGARMVLVDLYEDTHEADADSLVDAVVSAINPATRVVGLTWVHSGTGLKLPLRLISEKISSINANRRDQEQILLIVDGVHGFGIEDFKMDDIGADVFIAGCHKWLFGPRGTGIIWANQKGLDRIRPIIPSFHDPRVWDAWRNQQDVGENRGPLMSPGGFKAFEHLWALPEAFEFHNNIGRARIESYTYQLANELKHRLMEIDIIVMATPADDELSSAIICLDIPGKDPWTVVRYLQQRNITASVTPYSSRHIRFTPCLYNTRSEIDAVVRAMMELG
jgi:isopenicillin-N epimerase